MCRPPPLHGAHSMEELKEPESYFSFPVLNADGSPAGYHFVKFPDKTFELVAAGKKPISVKVRLYLGRSGQVMLSVKAKGAPRRWGGCGGLRRK